MPLYGITLWLSQPAVRPFVIAFAVSLAAHAIVFTGYKIGERLNLWDTLPTPFWMALRATSADQTLAQDQSSSIPLVFVDVDPGLPALEPPEDTPYYGVVDTQAAAPEVRPPAEKPHMQGTQDKVLKLTETTAKTEPPQAPPPEPAPPQPPEIVQPEPVQPEPAPEPVSEPPKVEQPPGDLALAKPQEPVKTLAPPATTPAPPATTPAPRTTTPAPRPRPRTLAEAADRQAATLGGKYKQEGGGVNRIAAASLDVKGTPFGSYDAEFIAAVQQRWYALLEGRTAVPGKVVLEFRLGYDGRVQDLKVVQNDVGQMLGLLCQKAILDPAPYRRWPLDMRREARADYREVRFTFYYMQ